MAVDFMAARTMAADSLAVDTVDGVQCIADTRVAARHSTAAVRFAVEAGSAVETDFTVEEDSTVAVGPAADAARSGLGVWRNGWQLGLPAVFFLEWLGLTA